jgi:hypothetical protein
MGLAEAGVSEAELLRMVRTAQEIEFDLRPVATDAMMKAGVSAQVIRAMAAREMGTSSVVATVLSVPMSSTPIATPPRQRLASPENSHDVDKLRIFVKESNDSWSFTGNRHFAQGGTHPQTVEVMKTFGESCPNLTVTNDLNKADYVVSFERESNKGLRKHNKFAAFNRAGDMVYSASTRNLGNSVRGFCAVVR